MGFNTKYEEVRQQLYNTVNTSGLPISAVLGMVQLLEKELTAIYQEILKSEKEQEENSEEKKSED